MTKLVERVEATSDEANGGGRLTAAQLDRLEVLAREPAPQALEPGLLKALVREAREARRLRQDARDQEPLTRLRAQELALRLYANLLDS